MEEAEEVEESMIHPEVSVHSSFKYKPGKPDRPKKVARFFVTEEEKLLKSAQKEVEQESRMRANEEAKPLRGRIYFDSIKSKIPKLVTTEELKKRKKVLEEKKAKGGKNVIVRKGSGNLAAAIGLYKSGQDLEKLAVVKRITDTFVRELKHGIPGSENVSPRKTLLADLSPGISRRSPSRMSSDGLSPGRSPGKSPIRFHGTSMVISETSQLSESSSNSSLAYRPMRQVSMLGQIEEQLYSKKHSSFSHRQVRKLKPGETVKDAVDKFFDP